MIALAVLMTTALAEEPRVAHVEVTAVAGARAGAAVLATSVVEKGINLGFFGAVVTDLPFAVSAERRQGVRSLLNLHAMPSFAAGWMQPIGPVEVGGYATVGAEMLWLAEDVTIAGEPLAYRQLDTSVAVGVLGSVRARFGEHWGASGLIHLPVPITGHFEADRVLFGFGVSWRR